MSVDHSSTVPLGQAFPWNTSESYPKCVLVTDSIETDGRFVLYAMVQDLLKSSAFSSNPQCRRRLVVPPNEENVSKSPHDNNNKSILWLSCHGMSEGQIRTSLKKIGCEDVNNTSKTIRGIRNDDVITTNSGLWTQSLVIHNILLDWSSQSSRDPEIYLKSLYHKIKDWSMIRPFNCIILDDVSAMENCISHDRYFYGFLSYLANLPNIHLIMRCSNDSDQRMLSITSSTSTTRVSGLPVNSTNWIGASGRPLQNCIYDIHDKIPIDRTLVEWADWVVDVVPLSSGPSREAHGRIVFTRRIHDSTQSQAQAKKSQSQETVVVFNYCLHDTSVQVIRLKR
jgi:hypothetical protein